MRGRGVGTHPVALAVGLGLAGGLGLGLAGATPAAAQADAYSGSYVRIADGSDDIDRAIASVVSGMSFVLRPIARRRLRRTNQAHETVDIASGSEIVISFDGAEPTRSPRDGTPAPWTLPGGDEMRVSTRMEAGRLIHTFQADDGRRENTFDLSDDGATLSMHVEVTSPRLRQPLRYTLRFARRGH